MNKATADVVRRRAAGRCEYCGVTEALFRFRFHVEHIIARQHGGTDTRDNLALACGFCNSHKGPNLSGIDPLTRTIVLLFHPRTQRWSEHFCWNGALIAGTTSHGRATVSVLAMQTAGNSRCVQGFSMKGFLTPRRNKDNDTLYPPPAPSYHPRMATETLSDFINFLDQSGELVRVKTKVSPILEIAAICDRVCKTPAPHGHAELDRSPAAALGGKALLFENVEGSDIPVAINTFGSYWRINQGLGSSSLNALADRVQQLVKPEMPTTLMEKMRKLPDLMKMASYPPKSVRSGICQQIVLEGDKADLTKLPIIQCWPHDGDLKSGQVFDKDAASKVTERGTGRYITLGGIHTINPETGDRNIGMYRVQQFGPRKCAMHWHVHHDGARHYRLYQKRNEKMPLAIVLGGESVLPFAATAPLPPGIEELLFAGFLNGGGIDLVKCKTIPLEVPANAEIVIEGWVDPTEKLMEGPFGDHTGFYSMADWFPAFHVSAITMRKNAIYPTTIVGKPPMEDYFLGKATERIFLPLLKMLIPDIVDYALPISGVFHNCAFVKIRKEYPYQARRVMHAIWGAGQMAFTKFIVVVDEQVNVHDEQDVLFHLFSNCDPGRDIEIVKGPVDILDHSSPELGAGSKIGFDATVKIAGEGKIRAWPMELEFDAGTRELVERKWKEYGIG